MFFFASYQSDVRALCHLSCGWLKLLEQYLKIKSLNLKNDMNVRCTKSEDIKKYFKYLQNYFYGQSCLYKKLT